MTPSPIRALIFMNGRNCARYVTAALESVAWQTHDAVHVLFVDDASTDETPQLARQFLQDYFPGRHTLVRNPASWGKARNAHVLVGQPHARQGADRRLALLGFEVAEMGSQVVELVRIHRSCGQ